MANFPHRHQAWVGALALILGFAIAASPTFAPPLTPGEREQIQVSIASIETVDVPDEFGPSYVDEKIALREASVAALRLRAEDPVDSVSRRDARARLTTLERELRELRCLR